MCRRLRQLRRRSRGPLTVRLGPLLVVPICRPELKKHTYGQTIDVTGMSQTTTEKTTKKIKRITCTRCSRGCKRPNKQRKGTRSTRKARNKYHDRSCRCPRTLVRVSVKDCDVLALGLGLEAPLPKGEPQRHSARATPPRPRALRRQRHAPLELQRRLIQPSRGQRWVVRERDVHGGHPGDGAAPGKRATRWKRCA